MNPSAALNSEILPEINGEASLDDLQQVAHKAHLQVAHNEGTALKVALIAGVALLAIKARKLIPHGKWEPFCRDVCGSKQTASVYMTLAEHRLLIEASVQRAGHLSVRAALKLIREHQGAGGGLRSKSQSKPKNGTDNTSEPSDVELAAVLNAAAYWSDDAWTQALTQLPFERFQRVMPPDYVSKLADAAKQALHKLEALHKLKKRSKSPHPTSYTPRRRSTSFQPLSS